MPTSRSSSNQNTRLFSPTVVLSQETQSIYLTLRSGEGYTLQAGLAAGDAIRYDPGQKLYLKSQADSEVNAEVVGVIETDAGGVYKVVVAGSIAYPQARLNLIKDENGTTADIDVLFLDVDTAGGLTGTINIPSGENTAIVKPIIQIAPHSTYNGIVVNYIGYKIGNGAAVESATPVGNVVYASENANPGNYYARIDQGITLPSQEYTDLYNIYGTDYGTHQVVLVVDSSTGISSTLIGKSVQLYNNGLSTIGTVVSINSTAKTITINRTSDSAEIQNNSIIYCNNIKWELISWSVSSFTIPPVNNTITQGGLKLVPYIALKNLVSVNIPTTINLDSVVINDNLELGSITDVEQAIIQIQTDITTIKNTLRIGGS